MLILFLSNVYMFKTLWKKLTQTQALEQTSGKFEMYFFETVYRLAYIEGISTAEHSALYFAYCNTVKLLLIMFCAAELWFFLSNIHSIEGAIDSVNIIFIQTGALCKYVNWVRNQSIFKTLASSMESPHFDLSTPDRQNILLTWVNRNRHSLQLLISLGMGTLIAWYGYPLLDEHEYNLPVAIILPFAFDSPKIYFVTYTTVVVVFSYISFFVMVNDLIMQSYLMHLLCQFDVLNNCFQNILVDCSAKFKDIPFNELYKNLIFQRVYIKRLGDLVEQHKLILDNTTKLRNMLSKPMIVQLGVSTTLLCSIGYQAVMSLHVNITKSIMGLLYLGYNMFVLFTICRWCEEVKTQSELTRDAIYSSGWECGLSGVAGVRSRLLVALLRGSRPVVMSAGGMYDLSLAAFSTMVKTSYSALTLLLRLQR
ncbi:uncharacterized protein LOC121727096 [Aricia agestis]|uniref:uncharacterized protein LOC121727096 n=1 Tax=Aricia agestis TaxID=91739 RepID=UPI001C2018D0|nr:uncharacterized protein LOC121727096 [Aricia agestis]